MAAALAVLMLAGAGAPMTAHAVAEDTLTLAVHVGPLADTVRLEAYDPRSPELATVAPEASAGLYTGHLATTGGLVRLVETPEGALGLVDTGEGLIWVVREGRALVPYQGDVDLPMEVDTELEPPEPIEASAAALSGGQDGVLQILLDGDVTYRERFGEGWRTHQLQVIALVDAIYRTSLDVPFEVVEQHAWTEPGALTGAIRCDGTSEDLLVQFRDHWETEKPTPGDVREVAYLFTRQDPVAHPDGGRLIGCGYIAALESSYAYSASWMGVRVTGGGGVLVSDLVQNVLITAHEIGHNFDGRHHRALPTPGSAFDAGCTGSTVMYPYLCRNVPAFSEGGHAHGVLEAFGILQDGGNAPWMRAHAGDRI